MEEFLFIRPICILCLRKSDSSSDTDFKNINTTNVQTSKKSIKEVLNHLAKCIEITVEFPETNATYACNLCYEKLVEYDKVMIQLLKHQKELTKLLKSSINVTDRLNENDEIIIKQDDGESVVKSMESVSDNDDGGYTDFNDDGNNATSLDESLHASPNPPKVSYLCSICGKKLSSKYSLRTHLNTHARRCYICGVIRQGEEYLELHMNVHEGKTENECRYCPKKYSRPSHVIRHMHMHWDKKKFQCEKCGLRFSQPNQLYNHRMIHDAEEKPLVCDKCDQTFKSMRTYKHHMVTHQEDRPRYPCEVCGKMFTEKYTLKVHLKTHSDDPQSIDKNKASQKKKRIGKLPCIICDKVFVTQHNLDVHMVEQHHVISSAMT